MMNIKDARVDQEVRSESLYLINDYLKYPEEFGTSQVIANSLVFAILSSKITKQELIQAIAFYDM